MSESTNNPPLKILFLSSDTGGGHRASAESLAAQFVRFYPGSEYELIDIVKDHGTPPYNNLVENYKHLSANPTQWKYIYKISNSRIFESMLNIHFKLTTERAVRKRIRSYEADVVISVHPLMTNVPVRSCAKISAETGRHLPIFTVVTDLGSGHCTWFDNGVEKMFIGSEQIRKLAIKRGKVPEEKLVRSGLPIRYDFAVEAERLGEGGRLTSKGKEYQIEVRKKLDILKLNEEVNQKVVLVMGGGEGVGSLSNIVDAIYTEFIRHNFCSTILVVCGRNASLKEKLENRDWKSVFAKSEVVKRRKFVSKKVSQLCDSMSYLRVGRQTKTDDNDSYIDEFSTHCPTDELENSQCASNGKNISRKVKGISSDHFQTCGRIVEMVDVDTSDSSEGDNENNDGEKDFSNHFQSNVTVVPLGFITNMAEYMVAADVLVSKAGPGTIAEAAAVGLPVLLTSFLPGQEEGNVDFVIEKKFGGFQSDSDPIAVATIVSNWLQDPDKMDQMSQHATKAGIPNAAEDIVKSIGKSVVRWKELNDENAAKVVGSENMKSDNTPLVDFNKLALCHIE